MKKVSVLGRRYDCRGPIHSYIVDERLIARDAIVNSVLPEAINRDIRCLCGAEFDDITLATVDRWGFFVFTVLCRKCGLIRLNPRWDDKTYLRIYKKYYWPLASGNHQITRKRFELSVEIATGFTDWLTQNIPIRGKKVIEIGCSYGAALSRLMGRGAELVGFDYDNRILDLGRTFTNLDLREGGVDAALKSGEKYDIVILRHVFEHFLYPVQEGSSLKQLLKSDGRLFIEVPGILGEFGTTWDKDLLGRIDAFHSFFYTLDTLKSVLGECGFVLEFGDERIYSCWSLNSTAGKVNWTSEEHSSLILKKLKEQEHERKRRKIKKIFLHICKLPFNVIKRFTNYF